MSHHGAGNLTGLVGLIRRLLKIPGCGACFPEGTAVATAKGGTAIEKLHVGDLILAEDPKKDTTEQERVEAVIDDGIKPLIALDLSDGSSLRVTSNHAFYVDGGAGLAGPGWLEAGQLKPGDRLRTADGHTVAVLAVHWNAGEAHVYTLTVAADHTFFVGSARVLVHNAGPCPVVSLGVKELLTDFSVKLDGSPYRVWWSFSTRT